MNKFCRICIAGEGTVKIFYENVMGLPVSSRIMNCALVKIFVNDGLPELICESCLGNLKVAYSFKQKCEESDSTLRKMLVPKKEDCTLDLSVPVRQGEKPNKDLSEDISESVLGVNSDIDDVSLDIHSEDECGNTEQMANKNIDKKTLPSDKIRIKLKCKTRFKKTRKKPMSKDSDGISSNEKRIFICEVCSKSYSSRRQMRRHQITHADKKKYCCHVCNKQFHFKGNLKVHERIHTGERPFLCNSCGKSFVQISGLQRHQTIHNDEKPFICNICNKRFKLADTLAGHIRTHTMERPYKCEKCNKAFSHHSGLNKHTRVHTGEKNYRCSQCDKSFGRSDSLSEHLKTHTGERPHNCVTCNAAFSSKSTLRVHMRRHTSEKPYQCQHCNKSFSQSSVLGRHLRTHTGERPFKCAQCDQSFTLKIRLVEHTRSSHDDTCDVSSVTNLQQFPDKTNVSAEQCPVIKNQQQTIRNTSNSLQVNTNLHLARAPSLIFQEDHLRYIVKSDHSYYHHHL